MVYAVRLPDGSIIQNIPDSVTEEEARAKILADRPELGDPKRSWSGLAGDVGASAYKGLAQVAQLPGQFYGLVTGDMKSGAMTGPQEHIDWANSVMSEASKTRAAMADATISKAAKEGLLAEFVATVKTYITDPVLLSNFLTEQVPTMIALGGIGRVAKGLFSTAYGLGEVGAKALTPTAAKAAEAAVGRATERTIRGAGAVQQGADVGADTYTAALELVKKQYPDMPLEQQQEIALSKARVAAIEGGALSFAAQKLPGGRTIERKLAGLPGEGRLRGLGGEALSEIVEEAGGKFASNIGLQEIDPNQSLTAGIGQAAGMAAIGGGTMGALTGARPSVPEAAVVPPAAPAPPAITSTLPAPNITLTPEEQVRVDAQVSRLVKLNGLPQVDAFNIAMGAINSEREADALIAAGVANVSEPIPTGDGVGAAVVSQPGAGIPTAGTVEAQPNGLAPTQQAPAPPVGGAATQPTALAPAEAFANILNTDFVYSNWSNVRDGSDRSSMLDQMVGAANIYSPIATPENLAEVAKALSGFKWFRAASPEQKTAALDALVTKTAPALVEPPVEPGSIRVYHGGSQGEGTTGRWVSTDRTYAKDYREGSPLFYLDLKATDPRVNNPDYPNEQGVKQGFTFNFELTPQEAANLRPAEAPPPAPVVPKASTAPVTETKQETLVEPAVDPMYDQAVKLVVDNQRASTLLIQKELGIGFNRASKLLEQMEQAGVVSARNEKSVRTVLTNKEQTNGTQATETQQTEPQEQASRAATPEFFDQLGISPQAGIRKRMAGKSRYSDEFTAELRTHAANPKVSAATKAAIANHIQPPGSEFFASGVDVASLTRQESGIEAAPSTREGDTTISARASANVQRLSVMLGSKLYGSPSDIAKVSVKELFQNAFDAIKGALEKGSITKGKVDIKVDENKRTITVTDNGMGMPTSVMGKEFLQIAGTVKETSRASGGLGVAKMLFLFENKELEVVSLRNGVVSRMATSGEALKASLDDSSNNPSITVSSDPATVQHYVSTLFPDGHGTSISIQIPESYVDSSTGEERNIYIPSGMYNFPVLQNSPLFDNIDVTFNGDKASIGSEFPINDFTPFANVKFDWGTARIYISKTKEEKYNGDNTHILSNGLWQFDTEIKANKKSIDRTFYIDLSPAENVKPEDPGYPFDLNRQNFSKTASNDFAKIFKYISVIYSQADFASEVKNFGTIQYINANGTATAPITLQPSAPPSDSAFTLIKPTDKVEVRDGIMYVNDRKVPELTTKDLELADINIAELKIPQKDLDPSRVMVHDNTTGKQTIAWRVIDKFKENIRDNGGYVYTGVRRQDKKSILEVEIKDGKTYTFEYGTDEELVQQLKDAGLIDVGSDKSLSDVAREKFGDKKFNNYVNGIGSTFIALRDILVQHGGNHYKALADQVIGTSVDNEYLGVSIKIPFEGMFINPCSIDMGNGVENTPYNIAYSMLGTMQHELAHFLQRDHGARYVGEFQRVQRVMATFDETGASYAGVVKALTSHIAANIDLYNFLHTEFRNGNFQPRGNRFKDAGYQQIGIERNVERSESRLQPDEGQPRGSESTGTGTSTTEKVSVDSRATSQATEAGGTDEAFDTKSDEEVAATKAANKAINDVNAALKKLAESRSAEESAKQANVLYALKNGKPVLPILKSMWKGLNAAKINTLLFGAPNDVVAAWGAEVGLTELKNTNELIERMHGLTYTFRKGAGDIIEFANRAIEKDPSIAQKLGDIKAVTTISQVDPSTDRRVPKLNALWDSLGSDGQRIYNDMRDWSLGMIEFYRHSLTDQVNALQSEGKAAKEGKKIILSMIKKMYETESKINPYFHLSRPNGEIWIETKIKNKLGFYIYHTTAERDAVAATIAKAQGKTVEEMIGDSELRMGNTLESARNADANATLAPVLTKIFAAIDDNVAGMSADEDTVSKLKDSIYQMYLSSLPEESFRKAYQHRKEYSGFTTTAIENFSRASMTMSSQLARAKYGPLLRNSILQARGLIKNSPDRLKQEPFVSTMSERVELELNPNASVTRGMAAKAEKTVDATASLLTRLSYIHYLSAASSALVNFTGVIYGVANLGARHGYANTAREFFKISKVWNEFGSAKDAEGKKRLALGFVPTFSIADSKSVAKSEDERRAIKDMLARGVSEITITGEMLKRSQFPQDKTSWVKDRANTIVGGLFHASERLSREVLYLLSYRMTRTEKNKDGTLKTHEQAVEQAIKDTYDSLGNMAQHNRPPILRGAAGRVSLQFMMYNLFQTIRVVSTFRSIFTSQDPEVKKQMIKEFAGIMGVTWMLAGTVGLPFVNTIVGFVASALQHMSEDDDDPASLKNMDFILWVNTVFLPEMLGETNIGGVPLSDIISNGPANAITGIDIQSRTSLANMWFREGKETRTPREGVINYAVERAGPAANMVLSYIDAFTALQNGDTQKGMEKLLPAIVRGPLVSYKYFYEGAKGVRGEQILSNDSFTTGALLGQAIGFRSDVLANVQDINFKFYSLDQKIKFQRENILTNLKDAYIKEDTARFDKFMAEVDKFNRKYPYETVVITSDSILRSIEKSNKARAESYKGVELSPLNMGLFGEAMQPSRRRAEALESR